MSPDTLDTRVRVLERLVAQLETRVDDLLDRLTAQMKEVDTDMRAFAPLLQDIVRLKSDLSYFRAGLEECQKGIKDFHTRLDEDTKDRIVRQEELRKERIAERKWMIGTILAAASLIILAVQVFGVVG